MSGVAAPEAVQDFFDKFSRDCRVHEASNRGRLSRASIPFSPATRMAWISIIATSLQGQSGVRLYYPIDVHQHTVRAGDGEKMEMLTFDQHPSVVVADARSAGRQALDTTLRAEAWASAVQLQLDEMQERDDDEDFMLRAATQYANQFSRFHREIWKIFEPASQDDAQRLFQAYAVSNRVVRDPRRTGRHNNG